MKQPGRNKKANLVLKIAILMLVSTLIFTLAIAAAQPSTSIAITGGIIQPEGVNISLSPNQQTGTNSLILGFQLAGEWKAWRDSSERRTLTKDADFNLVRIFDYTTSTPRLMPCTYWNEANKTGTWDWTDIDSLTQKIFETGAEPLFNLGRRAHNMADCVPTGMAINPTTDLPAGAFR